MKQHSPYEKHSGVLIKCPSCKHWGAKITRSGDNAYWLAECEDCNNSWITYAYTRINLHLYGTKHVQVG